jgi:hypothetical protein
MMRALSIGLLAQEALLGEWTANVIGVTSGGVFILTQQQRVLFLTYSPFHGPGTINLEPGMVDLRQNETGSPVKLDRSQISIAGSGIRVEVDGAVLWSPAVPYKPGAIEIKKILDRLDRVATMASFQKGAHGLAPGLKWLIGKGPVELEGDLTDKIVQGLSELRAGIGNNNLEKIMRAAGQITGYGRGLTPAADDCLAGVLLCLNRWKVVVPFGLDLDILNESMINLARQKTTSLSATIIQAATLGLADERIIRVLDGIITGDFDESQAVRDLVKMGHTSGIDSLVGITIALTA